MAFVRVVDTLTEWRARRYLSTLALRVGDGLAVAASAPGLAAAVDQHAAAVRDLLPRGEGPGALGERVLLAGYARGLLARSEVTAAQIENRCAGRWTRADWLALRLLAVCALNRPTATVRRGARPGRSVPTA